MKDGSDETLGMEEGDDEGSLDGSDEILGIDDTVYYTDYYYCYAGPTSTTNMLG